MFAKLVHTTTLYAKATGAETTTAKYACPIDFDYVVVDVSFIARYNNLSCPNPIPILKGGSAYIPYIQRAGSGMYMGIDSIGTLTNGTLTIPGIGAHSTYPNDTDYGELACSLAFYKYTS